MKIGIFRVEKNKKVKGESSIRFFSFLFFFLLYINIYKKQLWKCARKKKKKKGKIVAHHREKMNLQSNSWTIEITFATG